MNKDVNILFLGGAKRVSVANHFIESGKEMEFNIHIFSYELTNSVPIASVGTVIIGRRWKDDDLFKHLAEVIEDNHIHIILPFVDPAVEVAARLKDILTTVFIPCSTLELCQTMFDKLRSERWFNQHQIPVPPSFTAAETLPFPVIIKPRTGSASKGIEVITDKSQWDDIENKNDYIIQKYISNKEEYTVDCYVAGNGEIISIVPRIRLETAGGEVMNSITKRDDELITLSRKILHSGGFSGPITIQYIRDKDANQTYVMEINPRLGGGVIASIEAGANIPKYILSEYKGDGLLPYDDWEENTLMTRYYKEVIFHANHH